MGPQHYRALIESNLPAEGEQTFALISDLKSALGPHSKQDYFMVGDSAMAYEMSQTFGDEITSYYVENRSYFEMNIRDALISTYNRSINAILTSASILIIVTAIVGNLATAIAAAVCQAISLGTFCATLIILILLPALLATLDRFVVKKPSEKIADTEKGIKKLLRGFKSLL